MKRVFGLFVCVLALLTGQKLLGQGSAASLHYDVDPATCNPAATVIRNSEGVTVVIFKVPSFKAGDAFVLQVDLSGKSAKPPYPVTVPMTYGGTGRAAVAFDPPSVILTGQDVVASCHATVTVSAAGAAFAKVKVDVKADPPQGSHLGKGPGVKVVIVRGQSTEGVQPDEQILLDVLDALAPEEAPELPDRPY